MNHVKMSALSLLAVVIGGYAIRAFFLRSERRHDVIKTQKERDNARGGNGSGRGWSGNSDVDVRSSSLSFVRVSVFNKDKRTVRGLASC